MAIFQEFCLIKNTKLLLIRWLIRLRRWIRRQMLIRVVTPSGRGLLRSSRVVATQIKRRSRPTSPHIRRWRGSRININFPRSITSGSIPRCIRRRIRFWSSRRCPRIQTAIIVDNELHNLALLGAAIDGNAPT